MKKTALNIVTLLIALTGAVFAFGDQVAVLSLINPTLAHHWPFVLAFATVVDRVGKLLLDFLDDGELNNSTKPKPPAQKPRSEAPDTPTNRNRRLPAVILFLSLYLSYPL